MSSANPDIAIFVISIFAVPAYVIFSKVTYVGLARYARAPGWIALGVAGAGLALAGGGVGYAALCLLTPYVQLLVFALFAWIYRAATGIQLEEQPFSVFFLKGQGGRALLDSIAAFCVFAAPVGIYMGYGALTA